MGGNHTCMHTYKLVQRERVGERERERAHEREKVMVKVPIAAFFMNYLYIDSTC